MRVVAAKGRSWPIWRWLSALLGLTPPRTAAPARRPGQAAAPICAPFAASVSAGAGTRLPPPAGYGHELAVDWPEALQCPLVGLLDDPRQLSWHAELAGEIRDSCEPLTAPVQPEDVR